MFALQRFPSGDFSVASIGALSTSPKRTGVHAGVRACLPVSTDRGHATPLLPYLSSPKTIRQRGTSVSVIQKVQEDL